MDFKMTPTQSKSNGGVDIKTELVDRCSDVLLMLGINPMAMSTKIGCPISAHEPMWPTFRVNPATNRYYCSVCEPRGGSLEDLVIKTGKANNYKHACSFIRAGLGLLSKHVPLEDMFSQPDPISALGRDIQLELEDEAYEEVQLEKSEQEAELDNILRGCSTVGWSPYAAKLKIAPLGAMLSSTGTLVIPARNQSGYLHGVLEIEPSGRRTVHNCQNLQGAGIIVGELHNADILVFVRDWESQVAAYMFSGGRCTIAYLTKFNLVAAAQNFVSERVKELWLFKCDKDDANEVEALMVWAQSRGLNVQMIDTKSEPLIEKYRRAISGKSVGNHQ